jgi:predicted RNA binding protein YcfA (HicA-like mRNA interferase family)
MRLREQVWKQVKNLSSAELVKALERDGWSLDVTRGSQRV